MGWDENAFSNVVRSGHKFRWKRAIATSCECINHSPRLTIEGNSGILAHILAKVLQQLLARIQALVDQSVGEGGGVGSIWQWLSLKT